MSDSAEEKSLHTRLADWIEQLLIENIALKRYVKELHDIRENERKARPELPSAPTALQLIEGARRIGGTPDLAKMLLRPAREEIERSADLERVIDALLRAAPTQGKQS